MKYRLQFSSTSAPVAPDRMKGEPRRSRDEEPDRRKCSSGLEIFSPAALRRLLFDEGLLVM